LTIIQIFAIFSLILLKERLDDASFADQESDADRGVPAFFDKMLVALAILRFMVASVTEISLGGRGGQPTFRDQSHRRVGVGEPLVRPDAGLPLHRPIDQ
jgi:hypothetical protein